MMKKQKFDDSASFIHNDGATNNIEVVPAFFVLPNVTSDRLLFGL
jgi:hypothetical protein